MPIQCLESPAPRYLSSPETVRNVKLGGRLPNWEGRVKMVRFFIWNSGLLGNLNQNALGPRFWFVEGHLNVFKIGGKCLEFQSFTPTGASFRSLVNQAKSTANRLYKSVGWVTCFHITKTGGRHHNKNAWTKNKIKNK